MARTVILGAGVAGHTAALHLRRMVGRDHEVVVVAPNAKWNWIPSNIWVGVGLLQDRPHSFRCVPMTTEKVDLFAKTLDVEIKHPKSLIHFWHSTKDPACASMYPQSTQGSMVN